MARDYKLLNTQKNEVFQILQEENLECVNFSWDVNYIQESRGIEDNEISRLDYLEGEYYFEFACYDKEGERGYCEFSPGEKLRIQMEEAFSWQQQKNLVKLWAINLKKEISAPDLWAEIEKYRATLQPVSNEQLVNEPIPAYEVEEISSKLRLLADKIEKQFKLNEEQNQFVRSKLDYLADAAKRQPRRDWENIFIAVVINIAFQLALEPTKAQQLWQLVKSIIGGFIHFIGS